MNASGEWDINSAQLSLCRVGMTRQSDGSIVFRLKKPVKFARALHRDSVPLSLHCVGHLTGEASSLQNDREPVFPNMTFENKTNNTRLNNRRFHRLFLCKLPYDMVNVEKSRPG